MTSDDPLYWDKISKSFWKLKACKWMTYHGRRMRKFPTDLFMLEQLIWQIRPGAIIEFGTWHGASALWFCHRLELLGLGKVVTVDVEAQLDVPRHPRLKTIIGDSLSEVVARKVRDEVRGCSPVLIIEDSKHTRGHVRQELELYHDLVTVGSYFVVEDCSAGVHQAVDRFLLRHGAAFVQDRTCEGFRISANNNGWLKRVKC